MRKYVAVWPLTVEILMHCGNYTLLKVHKILEKVKMKKIDRSKSRERNASANSLRSISSKRSSGEPAIAEHKSRRTGFESSLPIPSKAQ